MRRFTLLALVIAVAGCGEGDPSSSGDGLEIVVSSGSYGGVAIDAARSEAVRKFGKPAFYNGSQRIPLGGGHAANGFNCKSPVKDDLGSDDVLIYEEVTFFADDGHICGWVTGEDGAGTEEGVGIGGELGAAREAYPGLDCGEQSEGGEPIFGEPPTFPYCTGQLGKRRFIWFGGDPISTIQMNSERLGR
jgi:hypothetical protein